MNQHHMRIATAITCMLAFVGAAAQPVTVKGELTFTTNGIGKIRECESGRTLTLGLMASDPYFQLVQQYWNLSGKGKTPVLIEVAGEVTKANSSEPESIIQAPKVVALQAGACSKEPQPSPQESSASSKEGADSYEMRDAVRDQ